MDLIAASYNNIGPFKDKVVTVNFHPGKYLIKAPIGSGKSFLFFDGPFFGLYKYASRQILNRTAKQGFVHLLFEQDDQYRLIERTLKPTKAGGESTQSRLYRYTPPVSDNALVDPLYTAGYQDIVIQGVDIQEVIKDRLEEIPFTNQKELDSHLGDLLPPQEVALSIHFLMQDAENVFELQPAQRVQVFKHLFGLVGIDHAKEILSNKRKELQTTIKVKGDTEQSSIKLRTSISSMVTLLDTLQSIEDLPTAIAQVIKKIAQQAFFIDIGMMQETIQIDQFSIDDIDNELFEGLQGEIDSYKSMAASLQGKLDQLEQTLASGEGDASTLRSQLATHQREFDALNQQLEKVDSGKISEIKKQLKELQAQQKKIGGSIDLGTFSGLGYEVGSLSDAARLVEQLKSEGAQLTAQLETVQLKQTQVEKDHQVALTRRKQLEEQLGTLTKDYDDENRFDCDLIKGPCPYVRMIRKEGNELLERQQKKLQEQLAEISAEKDDATIATLEKQKEQLDQNIKKIRSLFDKINRKQIQEDSKVYDKLQQEITKLTTELSAYEHDLEQQATAKEQQMKLQATIEAKQEQLTQLTAKQGLSKKLVEQYREEVSSLNLDQVVRVEKGVTILQSSLVQVATLIVAHKENQLTIKKLQEQEQMAKDLYTIFSKELMIVVLQDFLPILEQVINDYLAKMVEYEIRFKVAESADEKMELDISVIDHHGEREVKSLSGGQKAIIKIAWILAVSVLMKSKFLLLDETITSMDIFTIAKVADVLEDFVKSKQMKFYVVTHSPQIQEMDIWDKTVEVGQAQ